MREDIITVDSNPRVSPQSRLGKQAAFARGFLQSFAFETNFEASYMTDRFFPNKQIQNAPVARPVRARVFAWMIVIAVAGTIVSSGFIISARKHFKAVELGYQSEELRREAIRLDEKKRRLELERARLSSPVEIERQARKIGLERADNIKPQSRSQAGVKR